MIVAMSNSSISQGWCNSSTDSCTAAFRSLSASMEAWGARAYGQPLPSRLGLTRVLLDAGRSAQATLSGQAANTTESLYLSV